MEDRPLKNVHVLMEERKLREKKEEDEEKEKELARGVGDKEGGGERREKEEREKIYSRKYQETCFKQRTQPIVSRERGQLKERRS